jgi:hypothetical protein
MVPHFFFGARRVTSCRGGGGKCRDMSKSWRGPRFRQMSKRMSRHPRPRLASPMDGPRTHTGFRRPAARSLGADCRPLCAVLLALAFCRNRYERLHVAALTPYSRRRYKGEELERQICRTEPVTRGNKGDAKDLVNLWKGIYRQRGWSRYAPFDTKGGFNRRVQCPIRSFQVRREKWMKASARVSGVHTLVCVM